MLRAPHNPVHDQIHTFSLARDSSHLIVCLNRLHAAAHAATSKLRCCVGVLLIACSLIGTEYLDGCVSKGSVRLYDRRRQYSPRMYLRAFMVALRASQPFCCARMDLLHGQLGM